VFYEPSVAGLECRFVGIVTETAGDLRHPKDARLPCGLTGECSAATATPPPKAGGPHMATS